jgi:hypothetical protein
MAREGLPSSKQGIISFSARWFPGNWSLRHVQSTKQFAQMNWVMASEVQRTDPLSSNQGLVPESRSRLDPCQVRFVPLLSLRSLD